MSAVQVFVLALHERISYGNSVRPSVCLSWCHVPVPFQAQVQDFGLSPYESLVFWDKISCP